MPFISNGVYNNSSGTSYAAKPSVSSEFFTLTADFCNNRLLRYELASDSAELVEEPYFVYDNDLYLAGIVGDPSISNTKMLRFTIYHMDSQTYTDGTIDLSWLSSAGYESLGNGSNNFNYWIILPIKHIDGLKFYAFICYTSYYSSSGSRSAYAAYFCIIDYANQTVTQISTIEYRIGNKPKLYPSIQDKLLFSTYDSNYVNLYELNLRTGGCTTLISNNVTYSIFSAFGQDGIIGELNGSPYYPSNNYRMIWGYRPDISKSASTSCNLTTSNSWINYKSTLEVCDDGARIFPIHIRSDYGLFLFMDAYCGGAECAIVRFDKIEPSSDDNILYITHIANIATMQYLNDDDPPYTNINNDLRNFSASPSNIRPPFVIDYSKPNVMWTMPIASMICIPYSIWSYGKYNKYYNMHIMATTINVEDN